MWDVCQTPDFRKTSQEEHTRLIGGMFEHLTQRNRRLPDEWMQGQFAPLDRLEGDIDMLSPRLARVRTALETESVLSTPERSTKV